MAIILNICTNVHGWDEWDMEEGKLGYFFSFSFLVFMTAVSYQTGSPKMYNIIPLILWMG